ncbi:MAG: hypothetical protein IJJ29_10870, partial [Solobacterium sp.]|nr:hypothetical protein [Solobacterium sp.]
MKKAGMVVAVEMAALKRRYGEPAEVYHDGIYTVMRYEVGGYELFVLSSGAGEIAAAALMVFVLPDCLLVCPPVRMILSPLSS